MHDFCPFGVFFAWLLPLFDINVPIRVLFEHSTVESLGDYLETVLLASQVTAWDEEGVEDEEVEAW